MINPHLYKHMPKPNKGQRRSTWQEVILVFSCVLLASVVTWTVLYLIMQAK